jgi:glycosyltransferase involved in cell wall biosynthesis
MADQLQASSRRHLIPNGVNIKQFYQTDQRDAKTEIGFDCSKRYVIFVSDPDRPEKNYALAARAMDLIKERDVQICAVHKVLNEELVHYYNAADCLILTSFHEGSPNVIKEAMACNCPIVATEVGDVRWVLGETNGCYIAQFDFVQCAAQIEKALAFAQTCGRTKGRERILFLGLDADSTAAKIQTIYEKATCRVNER